MATRTYPDAVASENSWAIGVIAVGVVAALAAIVLTDVGGPWAAVPLIATVAIGLAAAWRSVRRITPEIVGGNGAHAIIPVLAIGTGVMGLVTVIASVVNPTNPIFIAFTAIPFALGLLVGLDVTARGYLHGWMQRVGFGRAFRMAVPSVFAALVLIPVDPYGVLALAVLIGSAVGGILRETVGGLSYLVATPIIVLLALFLMTM